MSLQETRNNGKSWTNLLQRLREVFAWPHIPTALRLGGLRKRSRKALFFFRTSSRPFLQVYVGGNETNMTDEQRRYVMLTASQAYNAGHIFPRMAGCEAALESNYGQSFLARKGNNLFGMKQHNHPTYGTISLPTREYLGGEWKEVEADFVEYPGIIECFKDRMATLQRLRSKYINYNNALLSATSENYIRCVSLTWSTDPLRAENVLAIFNQVFPPQNNALQVAQAATGEN